jgi:uncharacterized protein YjbI with pentapeptide repeats
VLSGANLRNTILDDVDMSDVLRSPPPVVMVDDRPLDKVLAEHEAYCDSAGARGSVVEMSGVDFRPMRSLKERRLTALVARNGIFFGLDLQGVQFQGADLSGGDFRGCDLRDADLRGAKLAGASFTRADMRGAKLGPLTVGDGRFVRTDFTRAVLRGADLRGAHAHRARFLEADMNGANLAGCDLTDAELEV